MEEKTEVPAIGTNAKVLAGQEKAKREREIKKKLAEAKETKAVKMEERAKAERDVKAAEKTIRELLEELAAL
jgi:hypothetical protein